ncbi:MAG: dTDP-4-dehydrorhamnose reductase [Treponema sp.]|nr:dTDP-4-dehydrorhamnose reductase [Treponema sp.]
MVWLIGSQGMLGKEVSRCLTLNKIQWVGSDRDVDITNPSQLDSFAESHDSTSTQTGNAVTLGKTSEKITWVVNCSGYTNVNKAEEEPEQAAAINEIGVRNITRTTRRIGAKLIHISTDYVFDGTSNVPYSEEDKKNPLGIYGKTKSDGENAIQKEMTQYYILRTAWLYGFDGKNFVYTMTNAMNAKSEVKVVNDQKGSPTFASDLASVICKIIESSDKARHLFGKNSALPYGIYNYTNSGEISWYDFASKIYEIGRKYNRITQECKVSPCNSDEFPSPAKRPAYSVLSKNKIQNLLRIKIPSWEESLEKFMKSERFEIK